MHLSGENSPYNFRVAYCGILPGGGSGPNEPGNTAHYADFFRFFVGLGGALGLSGP
jgi:hypothetical protein